jgi:hypothetical protein
MADPVVVRSRTVSRDKLAQFLPSPELIRAYEALHQDVAETLPAAATQALGDAEDAMTQATTALANAATAQAAADAAQATADTAITDAAAAQATADTALADAATANTAAGNAQTTINSHMADTTVHGTTGDVVGTSDAQELTNKTFGDSVVIDAVGSGVDIKEGSDARMGAATLVAGTVTVNTAAVTANSRIMLTGQDSSGTHGELTISARTGGTSFTITSTSATDTRSVAWIIFEPA